MRLHIIGSNSSGNGYLLEDEMATEALLLECGVGMREIKRAIGFNVRKVSGCLLTHEHGDHSRAAKEVLEAGIDLWASPGTHMALHTEGHHRARFLHADNLFTVGSFKVKPFEVHHDAAAPLGFLIHHRETGVVLFLTDSYYSSYKFEGLPLNNLIIEANYDAAVLDRKMGDGESPRFLRDRVVESHMSLETCKGILVANDLREVHHIVLIHLSDRNADEERFAAEIRELTGTTVTVARPGVTIHNFNKNPF